MMHHRRRWGLHCVASAEQLATMLVDKTWTLCSAFSVSGHDAYVFLNDATSEGGAQEYAVLKRLLTGEYLQIESITFSWCDEGRALFYVKQVLAGDYDAADYAVPVKPRIDAPEQHGHCHFCG